MDKELIAILQTFGYPVLRQGSMASDAKYPPTLVTFWNNSSNEQPYYDNAGRGVIWDYNIFVYSSDINKTYSVIEDIRAALIAAGWICGSHGFDAASDEPTHTGRGIEVVYMAI